MVDTDLLENYPERAKEIFAQEHPLGRLATADEVAAVVEAVARTRPHKAPLAARYAPIWTGGVCTRASVSNAITRLPGDRKG